MQTTQTRPRSLSPELLRRIDALDGCRGRWIVDCRAVEGGRSYALRQLQEDWKLLPSGERFDCWDADGNPWHGYRSSSPEMAALYCAATGWKSRLLWCSDWLDDDSRWPGGYDAPSVIRSNARVFRDDFAKELGLADGDADGIALDVRYVTDEMIETLQALESYPLISEDDHGALELELQSEAWDSWGAADWRAEVAKRLDKLEPDDDPWDISADGILDAIPDIDAKLAALFEACRAEANEYWEEQCCGGTSDGYWLDVAKVAEQIDTADLRDLTGLPLLAPDQQWRREPYPWPGADFAPLVEG